MRLIVLFALLVVGVGLFLQIETDLPYLSWVGHLPGDLIVRKDGIIIYFPLMTSFLASALLFLLFYPKSK